MTKKQVLLSFLIGFGGVLLAYVGVHIYQDHAKLHLIDQQVGVWQENAIRQQQAQQPGK